MGEGSAGKERGGILRVYDERDSEHGSNKVKVLWDSIIVPIVAHGSEAWMWSKNQRSRVQAVEMSYLRGACSMSRTDGESYESVYGRFGMSMKREGMSCGMVEIVKESTKRWFKHMESMGE